jgi:predicted permease
METLLQDIKFGARLLLRSPALTAVAALSLALGIGANTTIFTIVNAVLLNPLPVKDSAQLVSVFTADERNNAAFGAFAPMSRQNFEDFRAKNDSMAGMIAAGFVPLNLSGRGEPEQVFGQIVTGNYFDVLGATFALGRGFRGTADETPGADPTIVLGYGIWQRRFGGRPDIINDTITVNGRALTVVGVTAEGFRGTTTLGGPEVWVPFGVYREVASGFVLENWDSRRALLFQVHGRLKDGVSVEQARANLAGIASALEEQFPTDNRDRSVNLVPLSESTINPAFRQNMVLAGGLLMGIVGLVLLIACGNVANLLLARATARRQEIAVRLSLGAGRGRLIRQLLTESVLLAVLGGIGGILVAIWARQALWAFRPPFLQENALDLQFDSVVILFTVVVSMATGILFGLAPALQSSRPDLVTELKERTSVPSGGHWYGLRNLLVVGQVGLSFIALASAGLFLRSLGNAQQIDPGFDADRLMILGVSPGTNGYDEARGRELYRRMVERASTVAGVQSVAIATGVPLFNGGFLRTVFKDGQDTTNPRAGRLTQLNQVTPGYFKTMGLRIVRGRDVTDADRVGAPRVAIINETMAKQYWENEDALGRRFRFFGDPEPLEVIGIVEDSKYNFLGEDPTPYLYTSLEQTYAPAATVHVRASGDPAAIMNTVRRELQQLEPAMPLLNVTTLTDVFAQALWAPRMGAWLLAIFALLALILASIGLYGVMAYNVTQRTRELGIRIALGARQRDVRKMVVRQGLLLTAAGIVVGLGIAIALARLVTNLLFGVTATDPLTFALMPVVLLVVAGLATYIPAWRASRVDPVVALRI